MDLGRQPGVTRSYISLPDKYITLYRVIRSIFSTGAKAIEFLSLEHLMTDPEVLILDKQLQT